MNNPIPTAVVFFRRALELAQIEDDDKEFIENYFKTPWFIETMTAYAIVHHEHLIRRKEFAKAAEEMLAWSDRSNLFHPDLTHQIRLAILALMVMTAARIIHMREGHKLELTIFEVSQRCRRTAVQVGFCEGWKAERGLLILERPFQRFLVHSAKGPIDCRGDWTYGDHISQNDFSVKPITPQPWMNLHITDVLIVMDFCASCAIDLPPDGHSRLTIL